MKFLIICLTVISLTTTTSNLLNGGQPITRTLVVGVQGLKLHASSANPRDYYYTRTRSDPQHLRVSEEFKNKYTHEVKFESRINGTKYQYYRSNLAAGLSFDELVFETIDKMFRHRLSPFYLHHYDNELDKRRSADPARVSPEACARDLMYLVDKLPEAKRSHHSHESSTLEEDLTPELSAFFDSYARQESGLLMGNTFWVGAYDQCVNRHIFDLMSGQLGPHQHRQQQKSSAGHHQAAGPADQSSADPAERDLKVVSFKGRYCVSALKAPIWDQLIERKKISAKNYFKTERQLKNYADLFRLQVGICLPDSCDSSSLERHSDEIKLLTKSLLDSRYSDYELIDLYCLPDETSPLRQWSGSALNFLVLMTMWLMCVFLATLADVFEFVDTRPPPAAPLTLGTAPAATQDKLARIDGQPITSNDHDLKNEGQRAPTKLKQPASRVRFFVCCFSLRANYNKLMRVSPDEKSSSSKSCTTAATSMSTTSAKTVTKQSDAPANGSKNSGLASGMEPGQGSMGDVSQSSCSKQLAPGATSTDTAPQCVTRQHLHVDLKFLNAFKALIIFWIINGHIMLLMIQTAKNILYSDALLNGLMHFLIGATFGVDLFFTMTGFLTAYLIFNSGHAYKMRITTWLYLSFHRYWRLAPMYLLAFWFSRSVAQMLGSGPLWDYGTSGLTFRGLCTSESWWYPLTLTSNLHGLFEECMITSWYISCDMQFWLVSPIFIHLLAKSPLSGWIAAMATILASSKVRYDAVLSDKSARYDELVKPRADIFMRVSHDLPALYTHPHYRISAYLVGLLAGHYVYMIKSRQWQTRLAHDLWNKQEVARSGLLGGGDTNTAMLPDKTGDRRRPTGDDVHPLSQQMGDKNDDNHTETVDKHPQQKRQQVPSTGCRLMQSSRQLRKLIAYIGLGLFLMMAFASFITSLYYPVSLLDYAKSVACYAYAIDHLLMSIGASLIIITMCFGQWPALVGFLSHPNWTRLSKINYALLLLQCEAIYYQVFRYEQVPVAGTRELINILFNLLVTLYPVAFVATLVFEFPLANLEKLILP